MNKGIYRVYCNESNKNGYIGYTMDSFEARWDWHKRFLNKNKGNIFLQEDWNKFTNFSFEILEIIENDDKKIFLEKEKYWINKLNTLYPNGYNIKNGMNYTENNKKILSEKNSGENNGFYGKKHKKESKEKQRKNSFEECEQVKCMIILGFSQNMIVKYLNGLFTKRTIEKICEGNHWSNESLGGGRKDWLIELEKFNIPYKLMYKLPKKKVNK